MENNLFSFILCKVLITSDLQHAVWQFYVNLCQSVTIKCVGIQKQDFSWMLLFKFIIVSLLLSIDTLKRCSEVHTFFEYRSLIEFQINNSKLSWFFNF